MRYLDPPSSTLTCRLRVGRMLYPKTGFQPGDFAIVACSIIDIKDGLPYADNIVIKGKMFSADYGSSYDFHGTYINDAKYGESYQVVSMAESYDMSSDEDQQTYLQNVMTARQYDILSSSGLDVFALAQNKCVDELAKVKGIGKKAAQRIVDNFHERYAQRKVFSQLSQHGLDLKDIVSLLHYCPNPDKLLDMVLTNPYVMITEVHGIGWTKADNLAKKLGCVGADPRRIDAYVVHLFREWSKQGHTWTDPESLWQGVASYLELTDFEPLQQSLGRLFEAKILWRSDDKMKIGLQELYDLEEEIAFHLHRIAQGQPQQARDAESEISMIEQQQGWAFTEEQMNAVHGVLGHNVNIITGYAGTGKSSVVSAVVKVLADYSFSQCALSGRAAARLTEVTGKEGVTIHRLLGFMDGKFTRDELFPLAEDIIILDEISMVGAELFLSLLKAIPTGTKLIMLGDDGQLESIGLCNIFKDMLDSGVIPVYRLTQIHRQAAKSAIITESMKVRQGQQLIPYGWVGMETRGEQQDLDLKIFSKKLLTSDEIIEQYRRLLDEGVSHHRIQIVVPMKSRGEACTLKLNRRVQDIVNAQNAHTGVQVGEDRATMYSLRLGDRVICVRNMYKAVRPWSTLDEDGNEVDDVCPVYNGDRGVITELTSDHMIVKFDLWGDIKIPKKDFINIELGYALSCHKLQGSEADYVIIGFDNTSYVLLTREWVYTAITRAKKHCIIVAQGSALDYAINTSNIPLKQTFLQGLLRHVFEN